jgi:hypothetical protein
MRSACIGFAVLWAAATASAQSINVDFGAPGSAPQASYAGSGLAGSWNTIGVLPPGMRVPLVGLDGVTSGVELYMIGGTALLANDDPTTTGDDGALLDDMLIGYNNPVDVCVWFSSVPPGDYEVVLYGLTPSDPALLHRLRVDDSTPEPTMCGGAWPGAHQEGVSFVRFRLHTDSGYIGLHSGLYGGLITSGLNGVQLRPAPPTGTAPPALDAGRSRVVGVFPNPVSGPASIEFALGGADRDAVVTVVDVAGRVVWRHAVGDFTPGRHAVAWDGRDSRGGRVPAGVYFARLATGSGDGAAVRVVRVAPASR